MTAYIWIGSGDGNWADSANWSPTGYPQFSGDTATIDASGTYTVTIANGETDAIDSLSLNASGATLSVAGTLTFGGTNTATITAGKVTVAGTGNIAGAPDLTIASGGTLDISAKDQAVGSLSGAGHIVLGTHTLAVGGDNADTTFSGTTLGLSIDKGTLAKIGTGTLTLDGATMTNNELQVVSGNVAATGGTNQLFYLAIGEGTGNTASATISGGTVNIGGSVNDTLKSALLIGDFGGTGTLTQTGGTLNIYGSFNVGNQGGNGTFNLVDGTINLLDGQPDIGRNATSNHAGSGTVNISGGLFNVVSGPLVLGNWYPNTVTDQSSGLLVQTGGILQIDSGTAFDLSGAGHGEYDLDGGTLQVGGSGLHGTFNNGGLGYVMHWGGGAIQVTGSSLTTEVNITLDGATTSTLALGSLNANFTGALSGAGTLNVTGSGTASFASLNTSGALSLDGGTADFTGSGAIGSLSGTGTVIIDGGRTLTIAGAVGSGDTIQFGGSGATLSLADPEDFAGTIDGFGSGDKIELTGVDFDNGGTADFNPTTGILTIVENGVTYTRHLTGSFAGQFFHLSNNSNNGTFVTADDVACYCHGTRILTDRGEVEVQHLRIGDKLVTASGMLSPIRWIGERAYTGRFAAGNKNVLPIKIAAGALDENTPKRDLFVSPLHAMFIDGVLIPARALVNGTSIVQAESVDHVEYFHLELDSHDVIVAEGALSESFIDDDSRAMFQNAAEYRRLYPSARPGPAEYCAPVVEDGPELEAVRHRIAARAVELRRAA